MPLRPLNLISDDRIPGLARERPEYSVGDVVTRADAWGWHPAYSRGYPEMDPNSHTFVVTCITTTEYSNVFYTTVRSTDGAVEGRSFYSSRWVRVGDGSLPPGFISPPYLTTNHKIGAPKNKLP